VTTIAPGIDPGELGPGPIADLPPGPWIVYAGNTDRYQDLDVLRAAMGRVRGAGLLLVSAGSLESWRHCGLDRVRTVRTSDFDEVRSLLRASSVGVLPRAVCPGYPIKLLNYLGLGLPSVVACPGMESMPGLIPAPARDSEGLAAALQDLVDRPRLRRDLGARARTHVLQSCTWDQRAQDLERVYEGLLRTSFEGVRITDPPTVGRHGGWRSRRKRVCYQGSGTSQGVGAQA
jgi:glycosyltransferase involved in cell wall biosynthesis